MMPRKYKPDPRGKRHFCPDEDQLNKALDELKAAQFAGKQLSY